jgi:hypothetical protein
MAINIPDYDDQLKLATEIRNLLYKKMMLDIEIKAEESNVTRTMTTEEKYYSNGKVPSMNYIENTFQYTGFTGELLAKRQELAEVISSLEEARTKFEIYKMQLDLYRTESANQRLTS